MPRTHVERIDTDAGWDAAVPVIRQLWSHRDAEWVRSWREEEDYRLFGLWETPDGRDEAASAAIHPNDRDETASVATDPNDRGEGSPATTDPDAALVAVAGISIQRVLHHDRHVWIHDFVVEESRRGEGLGSDLLEWIEAWGRERDCEHVALYCVAENDAAREFYEAHGLEVTGQVIEREL